MGNDSAFLSTLVREVPTDALTDHLIGARDAQRIIPVVKTGTVFLVNDDGTINVDVPGVDDLGQVIVAPVLGVRIIGVDVPTAGDVVQLVDYGNGSVTYQGRVRQDATAIGGGSSTILGLSDVAISVPANLDTLLYSTTDHKWHNSQIGPLAFMATTGTPNSTNFLRGDGAWTTISGMAAGAANPTAGETSLDQFGGSPAVFALRGARGSGAGTASQLSDVIGTLAFAAKYDSTANHYLYGANIVAVADENIDATHGGMSLSFDITRIGDTAPTTIANVNGYGVAIVPNFTQTAKPDDNGQLGTPLLVQIHHVFNYTGVGSDFGFERSFTQVPNAIADVGLTYPRGMVELEGEFIFQKDVSANNGVPVAFQHAVTYQNDPAHIVDISSAHGFVNTPMIVANTGPVKFPDPIGGFGAPGESANWGFGFADNQLFTAGDKTATLYNTNAVSYSSNTFVIGAAHMEQRWGFMFRDVNGKNPPVYTTVTAGVTGVAATFPASAPGTLTVADNSAFDTSLNNTTIASGSNGVNVNTFTGTQTLSVASSVGYSATGGHVIVQTNTGYAYLFYLSTGSGVLAGVALITGSGTLSTGGTVNVGRQLTVKTSTGIATLAYGGAIGTTTFVRCIFLAGGGNIAVGANVSSSGIVEKQVGLMIGYPGADANTLTPLRGAVTNIAAQIAGNVQMYPSDTTLTGNDKWITAPGNYSMNSAAGFISAMLFFNGTVTMGASGNTIQAHAVMSNAAKYVNKSTVSGVNLGHMQSVFIQPTFTADTQVDITADGYGVSFLPKFTTVNGGELEVTSWVDVESKMTISNHAIMDLRIGHEFVDTTSGSSVTSWPWTRTVTVTTTSGSFGITGSPAFDASFVGATITTSGVNIANGSKVLSVDLSTHIATMDHQGTASGSFSAPFTFATSDPPGSTTGWTGTSYSGLLKTQYALKVGPLANGTVAVHGYANWGYYSEAPTYMGGMIVDASGIIQSVATILNTSTASAQLKLQRDDGTAATAVAGTLGTLSFLGAKNSAGSLGLAATVQGAADGTFTTGPSSPGALDIWTTPSPNASSIALRARFDSQGATHFGPTLTSGRVTASNMAIGTDGALWVSPLTYDATTHQPLTAKAVIAAAGSILSYANGAGVGYGPGGGAGGSVVQATNKSTGVVLSRITGQITMQATALAGTTNVSFTLTNLAIAVDDCVYVQHKSAGTAGAYNCWSSNIAAGSCTITVRNTTAGSLSEAILLQFYVAKSAIT